MGMFDKVKFWKKEDEGLDNFSDLGDFGLDDKSMGSDLDKGSGFGDLGPLPGAGESPPADIGAGPMREEVQPTPASRELGDQFGLRPQPAEQQKPAQQTQTMQQQYPQQQTQYPQQQYPQQFQQPQPTAQPAFQQQMMPQMQQPIQQHAANGVDVSEVAKEIEIMHAKLDAIRSTLDSINQRLASLERMASGPEGRTRYNW